METPTMKEIILTCEMWHNLTCVIDDVVHTGEVSKDDEKLLSAFSNIVKNTEPILVF